MTQFNNYPAPQTPLTGAEIVLLAQTQSNVPRPVSAPVSDIIDLGNQSYTVATLPTGQKSGTRAFVTDATSPTFLGTLTGGGAVFCPVFFNGTSWVAG